MGLCVGNPWIPQGRENSSLVIATFAWSDWIKQIVMVNSFATALNCTLHCHLLTSHGITCFVLYLAAVNFPQLNFKPSNMLSVLFPRLLGGESACYLLCSCAVFSQATYGIPVQFLIQFSKSTIIQRYFQFPTKKRCLVLNAVSFSFYTNPVVEDSPSSFFFS